MIIECRARGKFNDLNAYILPLSLHTPSLSLPAHQPELLAGMEVGPSLGMVKSSSLESLHNIVAHTIKRDMETGGRGEGSSSFRRPVDHSMSQPAPTQRGIDSKCVDKN